MASTEGTLAILGIKTIRILIIGLAEETVATPDLLPAEITAGTPDSCDRRPDSRGRRPDSRDKRYDSRDNRRTSQHDRNSRDYSRDCSRGRRDQRSWSREKSPFRSPSRSPSPYSKATGEYKKPQPNSVANKSR
jgi:hypothetical protein